MTLIELLVALIVLAIIFSGTAAALISFSQASLTNERRVQATALANRLHEELQTLSWDNAVLYDSELNDLAGEGVDGLVLSDPPTFDGQPLVVRDGHECDEENPDPDCRVPAIPQPYVGPDDFEPQPIDGRPYEAYQFITWADRDGTEEGDLKRFTTIVSWEVFGRTVTQRVESERAPTPAEISEGDPSIQFLVQPSDVPLDDDFRNETSIGLTGDFTFLGPIDSAEVRFFVADGSVQSVNLTRVGLTDRFTATIPVGAHEFANASDDFDNEQLPRQFQLIGQGDDGQEYGQSATVVFYEPGSATSPPSDGLALSNPSVSAPPVVYVGKIGNQEGRLCSDVTVRVEASGVEPGVSVTSTFPADSGSPSVNLTTDGPIAPGGSYTFDHTFPEGSASPWDPDKPTGQGSNLAPGPQQLISFSMEANNPESASVFLDEDDEPSIVVQYSTKNSEGC